MVKAWELLLASQLLVAIQAVLSILLGLFKECLSSLWEASLKGGITNLAQEEVLKLIPIRLLGIKGEWVLVSIAESRVVTVRKLAQ